MGVLNKMYPLFLYLEEFMKDYEKIKLGKLNFYIIDDNYINYLSQFDRHIAYNKNQKSYNYY